MTKRLARFALSDPVTVLVSPYVDWWDESQESGVVPEPIQGQLPAEKPAPVKRQRRKSSPPVTAKFNPAEPRDEDGKWTLVGAIRDLLKLAGKIDLGKDEHLLGSGKVDTDFAGARFAVTRLGDGSTSWRVGFGGEGFGQRNTDDGIPAWSGNGNEEIARINADRRALSDERDRLDAEWNGATPERRAQIEKRTEEIEELDTVELDDESGTAKLDEYGIDRLSTLTAAALDEAEEQDRAENAAWDEIERLEALREPLRQMHNVKWSPAQEARWDELTAQIDVQKRIARADPDAPGYRGLTLTEGVIPGTAWGDIHFSVELDEPSSAYDGAGPYVMVGVKPKGAPDDWGNARDWQGSFPSKEWRKLLRLFAAARAAANKS